MPPTAIVTPLISHSTAHNSWHLCGGVEVVHAKKTLGPRFHLSNVSDDIEIGLTHHGANLKVRCENSEMGVWFISAGVLTSALGAADPGKIRVLLITGGHDYEKNSYLKIYAENPEISVTHLEHTQGTADAWNRADLAACAVVVSPHHPFHWSSDQSPRIGLNILRPRIHAPTLAKPRTAKSSAKSVVPG